MRSIKYSVCLLSLCSAMTASAVAESLSLDLTSTDRSVILPAWVTEMATDGFVTEAGLPLPADSGLTFAVDREKAPCRLALTVAGTSAQPLLLNGYAVSGEGEGEPLTLCASCLLPFQEAVTLDFSEEAWATASVFALLPQQEAVLTALALAWETEDLPETEEADAAGSGLGDGVGDADSGPEVVWVEATSPSRDCPLSSPRADETPIPLMPTDHVTLRAAAFQPFASKTFGVAATATGTSRTDEGALRFRGSDARVVLGQPAALDFGDEAPCAVSAWIRPEKKDGVRNIVARGFISSPKRELYLRFRNGNLQFGWWCDWGEAAAQAPYTPALGTWTHVMGVFDGATYILYVNGQEVARKASTLRPVSFNGDWAIGRHATQAARTFQGDIAEVSFYKGNVSPEAVALLAQSRAQGISEASVRGIWSCGDRFVVLADTTPPELDVPDDKTLPAPQDDLSTGTHGTATATDAASAEVIVTPVDEGPAFVTQADGTVRYRLVRHWVAEDASGLETVSDQTLDLSDTVPPVLTLPADVSVTQRQGIAPEVTGMATATDNSGMAPTVSWRDVADPAIGLALRWASAEPLTLAASQPTGRVAGPSALLDETRPYTLSVTFKPEAALRTSKGDHTLIAKEYLGGKEVILRVEKGAYQFGYYTGANQIVSLPVPEEDVGAWVTLTGVYDGASLRLYRNGALAAEGVPAAAPIANAGRWAVGYNPAFANRQFLGTIGRAALWQRALSAREVAVLADGGEAAFAALSGGAQTPPLAVGLTVHRPDTLAPMTGGGVLLGDRTLLDERKGFSVSAAIRPDAALKTRTGQATIVSKGFVGGNEVIFRVENGKYQFGFARGGNRLISYTLPDEDFGQWVILTGVLDGRQMRLYRNGVEIRQGVAGTDPADYAADWSIGFSTTHANREFRGELRDVAIWSRPLSPQECTQVGTLSREAFAALAEPADPGRLRTVVRAWTATDPFGNVASGSQTLTVSGAYADPDGDGLCDVLEMETHGTDPDAADTDEDTLNDGEEVFLHGTSPLLADTDGDRLPDAWELRYGFDPRMSGETYLDPDGDGLANVSEWQAGTNPLVADTDGDGLNDGMEVLSAHSDPLTADIDVADPIQRGEEAQGAAFVGATGTWSVSGAQVHARERSGSLTYRLSVPSPAPQVLAIRVEQHNELTDQETFDLSLKIDGLFIARFPVSAPKGTPTEALFFLPVLEPGEHTFTLAWNNWRANSFVAVHGLRFLDFGGPDVDGNGQPDWQDARTENATAVEPLPETSLVSPVCVEGSDLWRDVLEIRAVYPETDAEGAPVEALVPVTETIGEGFYADIPLSPSGEAVTLTLDDRRQVHSFPVAWEAFDVTAGLTEEAPLAIREGDALRLFGGEGGQSVLTIQKADPAADAWVAVTNLVSDVAVPYAFEAPGLYRVVSEDPMGGGVKGAATVEVTASRFPQEVIALWLGKTRTLACPGLSPTAVLDYDAAMTLSAEPREVGGLTLSLDARLDRSHGMVSRLGEEGPVLDAAQVRPVWGDNGGYYRVLQHYADGSQLTEVVLQLGAVPPGTRVKLEIFVAGVTFEDGTRVKWLTAEDFDEYGVCRLTFIRGANVKTSVCHRTYIYQDDVLLGSNK